MRIYPVKQLISAKSRFIVATCLAVIALSLWMAPTAHAANARSHDAPWRRVGLAALGVTGAFVAHESGHLTMNMALGNTPTFRPIRGVLGMPFLAISPDIDCARGRCVGAQGQLFTAGARGRAAIAAAGFIAQGLTSEAILTMSPDLLYADLPLLQGWLAFNTVLSVAYAITCLTGLESDYGDAGGIAVHARLPRAVVATGLLGPALLDVARAVWPAQRWLAWASRASKAGMVTLVLAR